MRKPVSNGGTTCALFKFGKKGEDEAGIYGRSALQKEDFDQTEMENYFNYTGRLADEGTYETFDRYVKSDLHPADVILIWASEEGDLPKVQEILDAGGDPTVKDLNGKTAFDMARDDETKAILVAAGAKAGN